LQKYRTCRRATTLARRIFEKENQMLINGKWTENWQPVQDKDGRFVRQQSEFRNWVTADGSTGPTSGFSTQGICATPSTSSNRLQEMRFAEASTRAGGLDPSWVPEINIVGTWIFCALPEKSASRKASP
jgi:hypothetical protein